jgi:hypothetical protein
MFKPYKVITVYDDLKLEDEINEQHQKGYTLVQVIPITIGILPGTFKVVFKRFGV